MADRSQVPVRMRQGNPCTTSSVLLITLALSMALAVPMASTAQERPNRPSLSRISAPTRAQAEAIGRLGIELHGHPFDRSFVIFPNEEELEALRALGIIVQVVEEDAAAFFASRLDASQGPGSMGGYYTLAEAEARMDALAAAYPQIITPKFEVSRSLEDRPIWAFRMSDQPGTVDPSRPAVFYNSLIHAREPISLMLVLAFVEDLARQWEADDQNAVHLLASRELWFMPVINPDGYYYNEVMQPEGGYMWRKNKRDNNGDGLFTELQDGVDLNRNFDYRWGEDDIGSSPNPRSETYRGATPFSEPETAAVAEVFRLREPGVFTMALNYHSYGDVYIYPWGYTETPVVHLTDFQSWSARMARINHYTYGTGGQTIGYGTNGDAVDYQYGAEAALAMVVEVGSLFDYFWPPTARIPDLVRENLAPNHLTAWLAGEVLLPARPAITETGGNSNGYADPGETVEVSVAWENAGFGGAVTNATATMRSLGTDAIIVTPQAAIGDVAPGQTVTPSEPFLVRVGEAPAGRRLELEITVEADGGYVRVDTLGVTAGTPERLIQEDWESGADGWSLINGFEVSVSGAYGGMRGLTDAPSGVIDDTWSVLDLVDPLDLSGYDGAVLRFRGRRELGPRNFALVTVGPTPQPWPGAEPPNAGDPLVYYAVGGERVWEEVEIDLTPYAGTPALYMTIAALYGDGAVGEAGGWSLDDIVVEAWTSSLARQFTGGGIRLGNPYPNPANPTVGGSVLMDLDLRLLPGGIVSATFEVLDVRGRRIATPFHGTLSNQAYPGFLRWDGKDKQGRPVASGIYFLTVRAGGRTASRKVVILR